MIALPLNGRELNPLNRTNSTAPNGSSSSAAFITITSTSDPRQLQLGVKVLW